MNKLVFATNNKHKLEELRAIVGDKYEILGLRDIGCDVDIPETATTLEGNALIKAQFVKEHYGYDCFADDTGLEVEALDGAPGVYSARYAGPECDSAKNMALLLQNMADKDNRKARFRTVIALVKGEDTMLFEGIVEGAILREGAGENGFGYDPIFEPEACGLSFAQMDSTSKNAISHRGRATQKLINYLKSL
ncbi:MAG: non-canonical purine NTP diphosphatase [Muribaculaceae bacterium]|nr:non-canonical purine NTP diphosphatase [Muribaculaceae bacterium]